jgi:hypothetical protein
MTFPKEAYLKQKEKCKKNNLETESWKTTWTSEVPSFNRREMNTFYFSGNILKGRMPMLTSNLGVCISTAWARPATVLLVL